MSTGTRVATETLSGLRKRRSSPACFPCSKRKIKCRGDRPCEACTERKHPEICHVERQSRGYRRHPKSKTQRLIPLENDEAATDRTLSVGQMSAVNFVQENIHSAQGADAAQLMGMKRVLPRLSLGMFGRSSSSFEAESTKPRKNDVLRFFLAFRESVMPLYPVVPNPTSLETWIAEILRDGQTGIESAKLAVVFSCLALGAQFAEGHVEQRWKVSQAFLERASLYLQQAGFIFEPSVEAVQALLMMGIALSNIGLSDGAWNLLGLTYRCAQNLGLHQMDCRDTHGHVGAMLWLAVTWQDTLISLRYDRQPLTQATDTADPSEKTIYSIHPYFGFISMMCRVARKVLCQPSVWRQNLHNISTELSNVENMLANAHGYLSVHCQERTLQQRFYYHAAHLHSSLMIAEICRPSFAMPETVQNLVLRSVRKTGLRHLLIVVDSFLELCAFSNIPLRLWSLTQAAVSSALVLALLDSKRPCDVSRLLLRRLVDTLRTGDTEGVLPGTIAEDTDSNSPVMHSKVATLLDSILELTTDIRDSSKSSALPTMNQSAGSGTNIEVISDVNFSDFLTWPSELSLYDNAFMDTFLQANDGESFLMFDT